MRVTLDYRNPSPSHCQVAVFVNGALAGTLTLRQEEVLPFDLIFGAGCRAGEFKSTGNANPPTPQPARETPPAESEAR